MMLDNKGGGVAASETWKAVPGYEGYYIPRRSGGLPKNRHFPRQGWGRSENRENVQRILLEV